MKIKIIVSLLFSFINLTAVAQEFHPIVLKTVGDVTPSQEKIIAGAFHYLNEFWSNQKKSFSEEITKKYFDPETILVINGKMVYRGYAQLESHFEAVKKSIRGKIRFPLLEIIGVDDRMVVRFNEDISDSQGGEYPGNVIAIFTLRNGRILEWNEVVNSAYFCQKASQKTVYAK